MEYLRITKVIKTGTSLCVVIPKEILTALRIERGDQVAFGIHDENSLVIRKITQEEILRINLASAGATAI
jgi:antitoxin component of MazEF toxin-antitoxin module